MTRTGQRDEELFRIERNANIFKGETGLYDEFKDFYCIKESEQSTVGLNLSDKAKFAPDMLWRTVGSVESKVKFQVDFMQISRYLEQPVTRGMPVVCLIDVRL